jgi:hypothetical protein
LTLAIPLFLPCPIKANVDDVLVLTVRANTTVGVPVQVVFWNTRPTSTTGTAATPAETVSGTGLPRRASVGTPAAAAASTTCASATGVGTRYDCYPRLLVLAEEGSVVQIKQSYLSTDTERTRGPMEDRKEGEDVSFICASTRIVLMENASVSHTYVQNVSRKSFIR